MHPSSKTPQPDRVHTFLTHTFPFSAPPSTPPPIYSFLTFCFHTASSSSRQLRQVADRQSEAWQTRIITCGLLRATWQLYLQLSQENVFSSPAESSRPHPPTSTPFVHHGGTQSCRIAGWRLGGGSERHLHTTIDTEASPPRLWVLIKSKYVAWNFLCQSKADRKESKWEDATRGITNQNTDN